MSREETREEEQEQEQDGGCSTASTSGNSNPCPICLAAVAPLEESYLDHCFHKFCYKCIVQWTKVAATKYSEPPAFVTCPLCKTKNSSIIYGYDGNSFERHYIPQIYTDSVFLSEAHKFRLRCYYTTQGILGDTVDVPRFWRYRKYLHTNRWLHSWVKREIQALMQEEDVDLIAHHILGVVDSFLKRNGRKSLKQPELVQGEFKAVVSEAARSFLAGRAERFVDEMELFLASGLRLEAYDEVYTQQAREILASGLRLEAYDEVYTQQAREIDGSTPEGQEQPSETSHVVALDMFIVDDHNDEAD